MKRKLGVGIWVIAMMVAFLTGCSQKEPEVVPYDYDLSEYVQVANYKDLPYMVQTAEVTDEDVENEINSRLQYASTVTNSTEGVVEDGDTINIAFAGRIDGELFEGGSSESYDLTVGTTSMIDGFVEGLIGKNIGETVTLDLQFPEKYHNADVAGKPVQFDVTINSKRIITVPEFNDEFVQATSEFSTTDEYRANLKELLTKQAQDNLDANVKDSLWEVILQGSEAVQYPESEMADAIKAADDMEAEYQAQATLYGWEWADYLSLLMGTDEEGFAELKDEYAKNRVLSQMVMYKMARDENIEITQAEFEQKAKEILQGSSFTEESFQASYGMTIVEYAEQNGWRDSFLLEKLLDKVIEYGHEVPEEEFDAYVNEALGIEDVTEVIEEPQAEVEELQEEEKAEDEIESEGDSDSQEAGTSEEEQNPQENDGEKTEDASEETETEPEEATTDAAESETEGE